MIDFALRTLPFLWEGLLITLYVSAVVVGASLVARILIGVGFAYGDLADMRRLERRERDHRGGKGRQGEAAIPKGVIDAGKAIGLTPWQRFVQVRLPIMLRIVLPSLSNAFISLFKDTSLASVIAVPELTYGANWIKTNTFRQVEVWLVVWSMYLITGYLILAALRQLERRFTLGRRR